MVKDAKGNKYALKRTKKVSKVLSREVEILEEVKNLPFCIHLHECFYTYNQKKQLI